MVMNRRNFLRVSGLAAAAVGLGATGYATLGERRVEQQRNLKLRLLDVYPMPFNIELWLTHEILMDSEALEHLLREHIKQYCKDEFRPSMGAIQIVFSILCGSGEQIYYEPKSYDFPSLRATQHGFSFWRNSRKQVTKICFGIIWLDGHLYHLPDFKWLSTHVELNVFNYGSLYTGVPRGTLRGDCLNAK